MQTQNNKNQATILEIVRMSTEDGPGIRTTVFFKGCTLNCSWCHNPESISIHPQLCWVGNRCIGCKTCLSVCKENALTLTDTGMKIDRTLCTGCGDCSEECPGTALELMGKQWQMDDLVAEVVKDRAYFETSGGGITISGGEPTMQAGFASLFLKTLRGKGLHTALDTCGQCSRDALEQVLPYAAMVLFDIKLIDRQAHKKLTGHDNQRILDNLLYVADYIRSHVHPSEMWIRTPIIPGATATTENISGIGQFIASHLDGVVQRWELCAFNNLCQDKYHRLDQRWAFADENLLTQSFLDELANTAKQSGVNPDIVFATGATRLEVSETQEKQETQ
jgi:pyruvate formate lyase activating enzyme